MEGIVEAGLAGSGGVPDGVAGWGGGLALLLDELAHGVLIAQAGGKLLHANQAALHELARRRLIGSRNGLLYACGVDDAAVMQEALVRAGQGKRGLITLKGGAGPALTLAVLPLKSEGRGPARAALVFARASVCDSLMLGFFARSHGLTPTEEQVLGILCQGHSAPQVAVQMKVAVSTVRSHIRSLCAKTRTSGVRDLVSRVAVLPPVAPAFWHEPMH